MAVCRSATPRPLITIPLMHVDGMWRIGKPQSLYAGAGPNVYYTAFGQNLLVAERTGLCLQSGPHCQRRERISRRSSSLINACRHVGHTTLLARLEMREYASYQHLYINHCRMAVGCLYGSLGGRLDSVCRRHMRLRLIL